MGACLYYGGVLVPERSVSAHVIDFVRFVADQTSEAARLSRDQIFAFVARRCLVEPFAEARRRVAGFIGERVDVRHVGLPSSLPPARKRSRFIHKAALVIFFI